MLEVGIHNGGSIKIWSDYFTNANVYGIDIMQLIMSIKILKINEKLHHILQQLLHVLLRLLLLPLPPPCSFLLLLLRPQVTLLLRPLSMEGLSPAQALSPVGCHGTVRGDAIRTRRVQRIIAPRLDWRLAATPVTTPHRARRLFPVDRRWHSLTLVAHSLTLVAR
jgi:hypothetical protein